MAHFARRFLEPAANALDACVPAIFEGVIDVNLGQGEVNVAVYKYKHRVRLKVS